MEASSGLGLVSVNGTEEDAVGDDAAKDDKEARLAERVEPGRSQGFC